MYRRLVIALAFAVVCLPGLVCFGADAPAPNKTLPIPDTEMLQTRLLELVSQRTGYPQDMLDLDLDLEANLGIDSIKRVEILGALAESIGECSDGG